MNVLHTNTLTIMVKEFMGLLNPDSKKRCLKRLSDFRKVRNKFQRALHQAQKEAKDNPELWFYDEGVSAPIQGLELEKNNLLKLWEGGFWRRPIIRKTQIGHKSQDIATKKDWEAAKKNPRLRNREKGPPKEGWVWEEKERHVCFWRKELPFNPDGYLRQFQSELMVRGRRIKPEEPPNTPTRLLCEYALFAALHDYLEVLGTAKCDYLTDIKMDDWAECLCIAVDALLSIDEIKTNTKWSGGVFYDNLKARLLKINLALKHIKDDLLPVIQPTKESKEQPSAQVYIIPESTTIPTPQVNNDIGEKLEDIQASQSRVEAAVTKQAELTAGTSSGGNIKKKKGRPRIRGKKAKWRTEVFKAWQKAKAGGVSSSGFCDDVNQKGILIDGDFIKPKSGEELDASKIKTFSDWYKSQK